MNLLESAILNFDNWSHPWTFFNFIINNSLLTDKDKGLFKEIWLIAIGSNNWKDLEVILGCKVTQNRLKQAYELPDNVISSVVRAASYE